MTTDEQKIEACKTFFGYVDSLSVRSDDVIDGLVIDGENVLLTSRAREAWLGVLRMFSRKKL